MSLNFEKVKGRKMKKKVKKMNKKKKNLKNSVPNSIALKKRMLLWFFLSDFVKFKNKLRTIEPRFLKKIKNNPASF